MMKLCMLHFKNIFWLLIHDDNLVQNNWSSCVFSFLFFELKFQSTFYWSWGGSKSSWLCSSSSSIQKTALIFWMTGIYRHLHSFHMQRKNLILTPTQLFANVLGLVLRGDWDYFLPWNVRNQVHRGLWSIWVCVYLKRITLLYIRSRSLIRNSSITTTAQ